MFSVDCNFYKKGKGHDSRNQITPYFDFSQPTPSCKFCLFRESPTAYYNEAKIFINSYLKKFLNPLCFACSTLGLLPLHKSKWVQLNGKTLQVLKNSLLKSAFLMALQVFLFMHIEFKHPVSSFCLPWRYVSLF